MAGDAPYHSEKEKWKKLKYLVIILSTPFSLTFNEFRNQQP